MHRETINLWTAFYPGVYFYWLREVNLCVFFMELLIV